MRLFWFAALILVSLSSTAFAQNCDQRRNPHSFACSDDAFRGRIFPMVPMSEGRMQGRWSLVTYADVRGTEGPEFQMRMHPQNPRIPLGVFNNFDGTRAGGMSWQIGRSVLGNFGASGNNIGEQIGETHFSDEWTSQIIFRSSRETHSLQCRIFDRNRIEHLQCRWQSLSQRQNRFILRGYLGFLRAR